MDLWIDFAFAAILRLLKDKKEARKFEAALMKVHGKIEDLYPFLKAERDSQTSSENK